MRSVSVIIPAFRAASTLPPLIAALREQTVPPIEVIVVDDASDDATAETAVAAGARVLRMPINKGPGPARNAGVAAASGEIVCFTDADCLVRPDWIERQLTFLKRHAAKATTSGYLGPACRDLSSLFQHWEKSSREPFQPAPIAAANGHSLAVERDVYLEAGGMPAIRTSEDFAFGLVLAEREPVIFDPENGVIHRFRPGLGGFLRQKRLFARNSIVARARFGWAGRLPATFSPARTVLELLLTAGALVLAPLAPVASLAAVVFRATPFWLFLAKKGRRDAPWALFLYSAPMLVLRDLASIVGLIEGCAATALLSE